MDKTHALDAAIRMIPIHCFGFFDLLHARWIDLFGSASNVVMW